MSIFQQISRPKLRLICSLYFPMWHTPWAWVTCGPCTVWTSSYRMRRAGIRRPWFEPRKKETNDRDRPQFPSTFRTVAQIKDHVVLRDKARLDDFSQKIWMAHFSQKIWRRSLYSQVIPGDSIAWGESRAASSRELQRNDHYAEHLKRNSEYFFRENQLTSRILRVDVLPQQMLVKGRLICN